MRGGVGRAVGLAGGGDAAPGGLAGALATGGRAGGPAWAGLAGGVGAATGGEAGGATGLGLCFRSPGGAASDTGAPHCSQKSPSISSGPLQKRQSTAPAWVIGLSKDFFNVSSSSSATSSPAAAPPRGAITGVGAIFRGIVGDVLRCGTLSAAGGAGWACAAGEATGGAAVRGCGGIAGGGAGAMEAPH